MLIIHNIRANSCRYVKQIVSAYPTGPLGRISLIYVNASVGFCVGFHQCHKFNPQPSIFSLHSLRNQGSVSSYFRKGSMRFSVLVAFTASIFYSQSHALDFRGVGFYFVEYDGYSTVQVRGTNVHCLLCRLYTNMWCQAHYSMVKLYLAEVKLCSTLRRNGLQSSRTLACNLHFPQLDYYTLYLYRRRNDI